MTVEWDDLTREEQRVVEQYFYGRSLMLATEMGNRLVSLGLAEQALGGMKLSRRGRELFLSRRRVNHQ